MQHNGHTRMNTPESDVNKLYIPKQDRLSYYVCRITIGIEHWGKGQQLQQQEDRKQQNK